MPFLFSPEIRREDNAYFAAMNTPKGFVSEFSSLFSPYRRYIIKGGPGTGKSTLMKKVAKAAEKRALSVKYYYCSSDTSSLDAIVIPSLSLALLDGTAPHITEPDLVGVKDRYLDLAQFLVPETIKEKERIEALHQIKKTAYQNAYTLLLARDTTDHAFCALRQQAFDYEKCHKALERLLDRLALDAEAQPTVAPTPISALGCEGYVALDSYTPISRIKIAVSDRYGIAPYVFDILQKQLEKHSVSYCYSLSPLTLATDTLYLPQKGILITALPIITDPAMTLNCERFLAGRGQGLYKGKKTLLTAEKTLFEEALHEFSLAAKAHREMESYYIAAMNFASLNTYTDALIREIFPR